MTTLMTNSQIFPDFAKIFHDKPFDYNWAFQDGNFC